MRASRQKIKHLERLVGDGRCRHEPLVAPTVMQPNGETAEEFEARLEPPPEEWCYECRAPRKVVRMAVILDDVDEWRRRSGM